jgi:hypothetical protein
VSRRPVKQPKKHKDAEIILKTFVDGSTLFRTSGMGLCLGIAIYANQRGYRFLADYFKWLAERPFSEHPVSSVDPGDHVHLTTDSGLSDEIDFKFDTLTNANRKIVLRNAGATKRLQRRGSPMKQFARVIVESLECFGWWFKVDAKMRQATIKEIDELIDVLKKQRSRLRSM